MSPAAPTRLSVGKRSRPTSMDSSNVALVVFPSQGTPAETTTQPLVIQALENSVGTSDHVAVGTLAGSGITIVDNNIIIGHHSGVHSRFGQEDNVCYIGNIYGANVDNFGCGCPYGATSIPMEGWAQCPLSYSYPYSFRRNPGKSSPKASSPKPFPTPPSKPCLISKFRTWRQPSRSSRTK